MKSNKNKVVSGITESLSFNVFETSEVDGQNILARVIGPAFFPGKVSNNNVEYTREFWDNVLNDPEVIKRLEDRTMFGTIGHEIVHIDNEQLLKGVASHITTKMWIDENGIGMAEHLVLNTEAGRTLNTILRAGSKLRVSTRGLGNTKLRSDGVEEIVDYYYQRIDFVILPGFEDALPSVVESLGKAINHINEENQEMTQQTDVTVQVLQQQLDSANERLIIVKDENHKLNEKLFEIQQQLSYANEELAKYSTLGTPEDVSEALDTSLNTMRELRSQIQSQTEQTVNDIQETEKLKHELSEAQEKLQKYEQLGSPEEFEQVVQMLDESNRSMKKAVAETLSNKYRVSKRIAESLVEAHGIDETVEMLSEQYSVDPNYPATGNEQDSANEDENEDEAFEDSEQVSTVSESRRLPANLTGVRGARFTKSLSEALGTSNTLAGRLLQNARTKTIK